MTVYQWGNAYDAALSIYYVTMQSGSPSMLCLMRTRDLGASSETVICGFNEYDIQDNFIGVNVGGKLQVSSDRVTFNDVVLPPGKEVNGLTIVDASQGEILVAADRRSFNGSILTGQVCVFVFVVCVLMHFIQCLYRLTLLCRPRCMCQDPRAQP